MLHGRRTMIGGAMAGLTLVGSGLFAVPAGAQRATLATLVFISKRLDASTEDYRKWYIEHHAPDFLSFAKPYLTRYTQDFVEKGAMGEVDFDCISEFNYRSRESLDALLKLTASPEAMRILASHPKVGSQPGPHEDHGGSRTFSVDERLLAGPPRAYDPPGTRKQAVLLRRKGSATPDAFAAATQRFGSAIARNGATRVVLDLAVPEADRPAPLFDAVIQVWPAKGSDGVKATDSAPAEIEVANIVDLLSYESDLGAH
jgi:hypothetical protein